MQTYTLDLTTLLHILTRQKQNGVLQSEEVRLPGVKQLVHARLTLVQGNIDSCLIFLKTGRSVLAEGPQALHMLQEAGALEWRWTADQPPTTQAITSPSLPSVGDALFTQGDTALPRQTQRVQTAALETLPRTHRRILALVDGTRTAGKIFAMLALTDAEEFRIALRELHAWGMITWD